MSKKSRHYDDNDQRDISRGVMVDLESRTIHIYGEIETETSVLFLREITALARQSTDPVLVTINSSGGNLSDGFSIIDAIEGSPCDIYGLAHGICCSAATLILASCKRRGSFPRTFFLIHELSQMAGDSLRYREIEEEAKVVKRMMTSMVDVYSKATKTSRDDIEADLDKTKWMTAQEALAYGLVDEIVTQFPFQVQKKKTRVKKTPTETNAD